MLYASKHGMSDSGGGGGLLSNMRCRHSCRHMCIRLWRVITYHHRAGMVCSNMACSKILWSHKNISVKLNPTFTHVIALFQKQLKVV